VCPYPYETPNGHMNVSHDRNSVMYICDSDKNQKHIRNCSVADSNENEAPICDLLNCNIPIQVENATVELSGLAIGSNATYRCLDGFRHSNKINVAFCLRNLTWTKIDIKCARTKL
jgi:hypothetical protein